MCVTTPSAWPWLAHLVSGLCRATQSPCSDSLSLRLPYPVKLATQHKSLTHYAKGTQSPLAGLLLFVCMRFQNLFHSPPGVLFAFPSQYLFAIGRSLVFSLGGWSPRLQPGFHVPRPTFRILSTLSTVPVRGCHPLRRTFPGPSGVVFNIEFRLLRFRSPLLAQSRLISFPEATEMFQFASFASEGYVFTPGSG